MMLRDIVKLMRHDSWGERAGKVELARIRVSCERLPLWPAGWRVVQR
jgi:hypothetical protein